MAHMGSRLRSFRVEGSGGGFRAWAQGVGGAP